MESFGLHLKELREEKGKSLEDISLSTKIAMTNLDFLENDRYDLLPPLVFVKGFVRSYARELGQDVDDTVKKLEDFIGEQQPHNLVEEKSLVPVESSQHGLSFVQNVWFNRVLTAVGALSLLILVLTGVSRVFLEGDHKANDTISKTGNPVSAQPGRSEKSRPSLTTVKPTQAGKKVLEIKAIANAWVRVEPDNGPAEEMLMSPGDIQVFTAKNNFRVITGNAGGIRMRFDGRVMPVLGKPNQTLALTLP